MFKQLLAPNWELPKIVVITFILVMLAMLVNCIYGRRTQSESPPPIAGTTATFALAVKQKIVATATRRDHLTPSPPPSPTIPATVVATATMTPLPPPYFISRTIGFSLQERAITSYQFGNGDSHVIFVGGIHGGYEWNTILLAYLAIDHFRTHPDLVPDNITIHIIPSANPDGQFLITGQNGRFTTTHLISDTIPGRFNARGVDLNRNWHCQWQETATWRSQPVSGGSHPFSEPENRSLRNYFLQKKPKVIIFWHSAANAVFASGCPELYPPSLELAQIYGQAAGYQTQNDFQQYKITGDASDWLATQNIPAISVELETHQSLDWPQNLAGILAILMNLEGNT